MTTFLHVAADGEITVTTWPGSETGSCQRCHVAARVYGPEGHPLCTDCQAETGKAAAPAEGETVTVPEPRQPELASGLEFSPGREPEFTLF